MKDFLKKGLAFLMPKTDEIYEGKEHVIIAKDIIKQKGMSKEFANSKHNNPEDFVTFELGAIKIRNDNWQRAVVVSVKTYNESSDVRCFMKDYKMLGFSTQVLKDPN